LLIVVMFCGTAACRKSSAATETTPPPEQTPATQPAEPELPKPMPAELPDVLARVNDETVTKADFDMLVRNIELNGGGPIPAERRDEILRAALDQLITYTVLTQEAKARSITVNESEIEQSVGEMRKKFPTQDEFQKALASRGLSVDRLRNDTRNRMVISKMMDAQVSAAVPASDAEAKEFYEKNPDEFTQGESVRASHILIRVDDSADEAAKKKARAQIDDLLKRAKGGEDFGALAKEHSQDGSAAMGGDLNYFPRGQMVPAFDQAAFALKPGEMSEVVTTQFGYHVIKVTDYKEATTLPLEQVNEQLKQFLSDRKKQEIADQFINALKQKSKIEVLV
jgi:peptidyl-prolyl cis-trans isomerase C